jgi:hypothetical protein
MPRSCSTATELQEIKLRAEAGHRAPDAKDGGSPGGELDCERNPVKLAANLRNHGGFIVAERKVAATRSNTLGE